MNDPYLTSLIRDIPDFPKKGIMFKDISGLLASAKARKELTAMLAHPYKNQQIDVVVGVESRGFLFGMLLADALDARFVMVRKPGKLPGKVLRQEYELEYGTDVIEMQYDAIQSTDKVLVHDDVLATGGTAKATCQLIESTGATIAGYSFIIDLTFLNGANRLGEYPVHSVLSY